MIDVEAMNDYFAIKLPEENDIFVPNVNISYDFSRRFNFSNITESEIIPCILSIKSNAVGEDKISLRFIRLVLPYIISPLTHIINFSLTSLRFPDA